MTDETNGFAEEVAEEVRKKLIATITNGRAGDLADLLSELEAPYFKVSAQKGILVWIPL